MLTLTIHLKYEIYPAKMEEFKAYAKQWIPLVEKFGGTHHGYFLPYESSNYIAYALFSFPNLTEYEKYRLLSADDPDCQKAYEYAKQTDCIRHYERSFMKALF